MTDFLRVSVGYMFSFVAYVAFFVAVYKLFQISTALDEIKELLKSQRRSDFSGQGPASPSVSSGDAFSDDAAAEYAKNLLRAVNEEEQRAAAERSATGHAGTH